MYSNDGKRWTAEDEKYLVGAAAWAQGLLDVTHIVTKLGRIPSAIKVRLTKLKDRIDPTHYGELQQLLNIYMKRDEVKLIGYKRDAERKTTVANKAKAKEQKTAEQLKKAALKTEIAQLKAKLAALEVQKHS